MDELARRARELDAGWQTAEVETQLGFVQARLRRRRVKRVALAAAASIVLLVGAAGVARTWHVAPRTAQVMEARAPEPAEVPRLEPPSPPLLLPSLPPSPADAPIALGDGSAIFVDAATSRVVTRRVSATEVAIGLDAGGARFEVPEQPARQFRVIAGAVSVETRGARFHVRRIGQRVEVAADGGEVVVRWGHERALVAPGAVASFPPRAAAAPAASESMDELLAAADAARVSGAPAEAAQALERALALHAVDARAPLAAFTLGRVQLEELGAPRAAADAFARAQALAPAGPLAEDALAREVEAWSRAGDREQARARATAYLARYPDGRRARAVRQFGGLASAP